MHPDDDPAQRGRSAQLWDRERGELRYRVERIELGRKVYDALREENWYYSDTGPGAMSRRRWSVKRKALVAVRMAMARLWIAHAGTFRQLHISSEVEARKLAWSQEGPGRKEAGDADIPNPVLVLPGDGIPVGERHHERLAATEELAFRATR